VDSRSVQMVLDGVFAVQDRLLWARFPSRALEAGDDEEPQDEPTLAEAQVRRMAAFRTRALALMQRSPHGVAWSDLSSGADQAERVRRGRVLAEAEREGLCRCHRNPGGGRRYFAIEAGERAS
jgi:hypothetical protein